MPYSELVVCKSEQHYKTNNLYETCCLFIVFSIVAGTYVILVLLQVIMFVNKHVLV